LGIGRAGGDLHAHDDLVTGCTGEGKDIHLGGDRETAGEGLTIGDGGLAGGIVAALQMQVVTAGLSIAGIGKDHVRSAGCQSAVDLEQVGKGEVGAQLSAVRVIDAQLGIKRAGGDLHAHDDLVTGCTGEGKDIHLGGDRETAGEGLTIGDGGLAGGTVAALQMQVVTAGLSG